MNRHTKDTDPLHYLIGAKLKYHYLIEYIPTESYVRLSLWNEDPSDEILDTDSGIMLISEAECIIEQLYADENY